MTYEEKAQLFRFLDSSNEAIAMRLRAARMLVAEQQKDFAELVGINSKTYHAQEKAGSPSNKVLDYLYKNARVGPNFIIVGEFSPLPGDVQNALETALRSAS